MAWTDRDGNSFVTRIVLAIVKWLPTRFSQGDGLAKDVEWLKNLKVSGIRGDTEGSWSGGSNADQDGFTDILCVDWTSASESILFDPTRSKYSDTNIGDNLENRMIWIEGTISLGSDVSMAAAMPDAASPEFLTTQWDNRATVPGPEAGYADFKIEGNLFTKNGEANNTGTHVFKWLETKPGGGATYSLYIYLDSDDDKLHILWVDGGSTANAISYALWLRVGPVLVD